ncbi:MAG: DUF1311 domain-containing protein [Clostridiales bacterium]|nr:DUF1311 domain-containing protein [Clostridiales bacterium]
MKKKLLALLTALCLLFAAACLAEDDVQVDVTLEGYMEAGGRLYVTWTDEAYETDGLGLIGTVGQTIGEMLQHNDILSVEPMLEGDVFEGWMEVAETVVADEFGFEDEVYSLITDRCYTTEELMALPVPEYNVTYMAKWAGIPAEAYFAPYEETVVFPSITLLSGDGTILINGEEEQSEIAWRVVTPEPGQTFGEVLELDKIAAVTAEGKLFAGWTVYEYDVETMEVSETCVEEEGVLCFELFEEYHMVLREYTVCHELISTEELSAVVCEETDHVVVATWMTAEEYLAYVKEQSDAIKVSLEQEPLTQTDMNLKSEELRVLWDEALNLLLDEAKKSLPEAELEKLTAEQSAWEADMKMAVEAAGKEVEGGSMYPLVANTEAAKLAEERVYNLCELLK